LGQFNLRETRILAVCASASNNPSSNWRASHGDPGKADSFASASSSVS
jgi:hypothetical protein